MKQNSVAKIYTAELQAWNKVHRIVGSNDIAQLYYESEQALLSLPKNTLNLVDVGAGSGILGFAALPLWEKARVAFVEPDVKKAAFLIHIKAKIRAISPETSDRMTILSKDIQSVSRETLDQFFQTQPFVLISRAFSGPLSLNEALTKGSIKNIDVFCFQNSQENKFVLEKLK